LFNAAGFSGIASGALFEAQKQAPQAKADRAAEGPINEIDVFKHAGWMSRIKKKSKKQRLQVVEKVKTPLL
jgi:hypothetical protein